MTWRPVRNYLILKVEKPQAEKKTDGGIVVVQGPMPEQEPVGEIVALGPQVDTDLKLSAGDAVLFEPLHAFDVEGPDKTYDYLAISDKYILCVGSPAT